MPDRGTVTDDPPRRPLVATRASKAPRDAPSDNQPTAQLGARLGVRAGDGVATAVAVGGFLVLRVISVRLTPVVYVDSGDYRDLGLLGGARRLPTVPLLFKLVPSDTWRIVEQAVISASAWITLALVVAAGVADRRVRLGALVTLLALGLTTQVTSWDSAILSDSIAISLTVLMVAAWIAVRRAPTPMAIGLVLAFTLLWALTREVHVYVTVLIAVVVGIVAITRRGRPPWIALAVGLALIAVAAVVVDHRNQDTAIENLAGVIGGRVFSDRDALAWFEDAGMPAVSLSLPGGAVPDKTLLAIPEFARWVRADGLNTYARYLLTHPIDLVTGPYGDLLEERPTYGDPQVLRPVLLSPAEAYGRARPVLPSAVEDVLLSPGRTGALLALAVVTMLGAFVARLRLGRDGRRGVPLAVVALVLLYVGLAWHGSVFEPGRHAMPGAVALRLGLLALLAATLDQWATARRAGVPLTRAA